ncbi:MAG TPA: hypothetical protein VHB79_13475 [Polyangiaceae bacterium]|nr:hypothetical protein [Polyangiaceae bacterium]
MLRKCAALGQALVLVACGGGAVTPAQSPTAGGAPAPGATADKPGTLSESKVSGSGELPPGLPPPGPECAAFASEAPLTCANGDFNERLAVALEAPADERNRLLRCLEKAPEAPGGLMRALRADLAPRGCADDVLGSRPADANTPRDVSEMLVALAVGARLYRSVRQPPLPHPPFSKAEFSKQFKEVLTPWISAQAHAVDVLSQVGPRLSGYAKAIVALEAGLADMRFVNVARSIELPDEMKADPEIKETYLVTLEQALEPRVLRGRDAALVGLGELQRLGILNDVRLNDARKLLSELFAGRRIDALDKLLLPALPALDTSSPALKIAAKLPAFYMLKLAASPSVDDPKLLRARLEQGAPPALWLNANSGGPPAPELASLNRRALFSLGQTYFWAEPFTRSAGIAAAPGDAEGALVVALSSLLAHGPRNAAALMLGPPTLPAELRETSGLDALAKQKGQVAGLAEFDAAYVRSLAPPANDPAFWRDEAQRYQRAQKKLTEKDAKLAADLAKAAGDTEKALKDAKNGAPPAAATKAP